jgi:hypothetical protein
LDDAVSARRQAGQRPGGGQVGALARWEAIAREQHPGASEAEITRAAEALRTAHFRRMGQRSAQSRREKDGHATPADANASPMHPNSPLRWQLLAREPHPGVSEAEITRAADALRAGHYRRIWETRRAAAAGSPR